MIYGKYINENKIVYSPKTIRINNTYYNPTPLFWLLEKGYKQVVNTQPQNGQITYHWEIIDNKIVKVWENQSIQQQQDEI